MPALWQSSDKERWQAQLDGYWGAVKGCSTGKKSELLELDRWYFEQLPPLLRSRGKQPYLTKEELVKLVRWKLTRGKWRPLLRFAEAAADIDVRTATGKGLALLAPHVEAGRESPAEAAEEALKAVSTLKGVGPATASAMLGALDPSVPFMSDEALEAAVGSRKYSVAEFCELLGVLRGKARQLSAAGGRRWTAQEVERCLFAEAAHAAAGSAKSKGPAAGGSGSKRAGGSTAQPPGKKGKS